MLAVPVTINDNCEVVDLVFISSGWMLLFGCSFEKKKRNETKKSIFLEHIYEVKLSEKEITPFYMFNGSAIVSRLHTPLIIPNFHIIFNIF